MSDQVGNQNVGFLTSRLMMSLLLVSLTLLDVNKGSTDSSVGRASDAKRLHYMDV